MEKVEREDSGWKYYWKAIFLKGSPTEVKEALLSWAEGAFREVQKRTKVRRVRAEYTVGTLVYFLEKGWAHYVKFSWGGDIHFGASKTSVFMGAFYRLGAEVWAGAMVARLQGWGDHYKMAYNILTREHPRWGATPPEDPALLAEAIARPERARLLEREDLKRRNLKALRALLPPSLAEPLAEAVSEEIHPRNLRVWDGVALYRERKAIREGWEARFLVFDGKAHRLEGEAWEIARRILRKRKGTPLEKARMAMLMVRLGK